MSGAINCSGSIKTSSALAPEIFLAPEEVDTLFPHMSDVELMDFIAMRSRYMECLFKKLDECKAAGHDRISAAI